MIDERTEELASLYALGLLQDAELRDFEKSLSESAELRQLVDRLREASTTLSALAPQQSPTSSLRDRILRIAAETPQTGVSAAAPLQSDRPNRSAGPAWPLWLGWGLAASLAVFTYQQHGRLAQTDQDRLAAIAQVNQERQKAAEVEKAHQALLDASNARIAALERATSIAELKIARLALLNGNSPAAVAIAVWNPTANEGILSVDNLPQISAAEDYQLWVIDPQVPDPVSAGVIQMNANGTARVTFTPTQRVNAAAQFAISRERKGGVEKVQGPIVAAGSL